MLCVILTDLLIGNGELNFAVGRIEQAVFMQTLMELRFDLSVRLRMFSCKTKDFEGERDTLRVVVGDAQARSIAHFKSSNHFITMRNTILVLFLCLGLKTLYALFNGYLVTTT
jgi:hypothetical protein